RSWIGSGWGFGGVAAEILRLKLMPRVDRRTLCPNSSSLFFPGMWYCVFLGAPVLSLFFHVPAGLLALFTLRHHKTVGSLGARVYQGARQVTIPFEVHCPGHGTDLLCRVSLAICRILDKIAAPESSFYQ
uniref:Transmembrane protein 170A n=1 Tax=Oryctolagus cuniculus TaxID=9986 RepID=A0A5F9D922_RABIT